MQSSPRSSQELDLQPGIFLALNNTTAQTLWERLSHGEYITRTLTWLNCMSGRIGSPESIVTGRDGAMVSYDLMEPSPYRAFDPAGKDGRTSDYPALGCAIPNAYMAGYVGEDVTEPLQTWINHGRNNYRTRGVLNVELSKAGKVRDLLVQAGYVEYLSGAQGILDLPNGPESYLGELTARHRRRARKEMRIFKSAGFDVRALEVTDFNEDLAQLQLDTYARHGFAGGSTDHVMRSHEKAIEDFGDSYGILVATGPDDSPAGFLSFIRGESSAQPRHLGIIQTQQARSAGLYFNLAYYALIRHLQGTAVKTINYGPEALKVKKLRGCRIEPMVNFISTDSQEVHDYWAQRDLQVRGDLTQLGAH